MIIIMTSMIQFFFFNFVIFFKIIYKKFLPCFCYKPWMYKFVKIIYCKGRKFLPLISDGQWLRTVGKYTEEFQVWQMKLPLNPLVPSSVPVVPLSIRLDDVAGCTPSVNWVWHCNFLPTKNGKILSIELIMNNGSWSELNRLEFFLEEFKFTLKAHELQLHSIHCCKEREI